MYLQFKYYRVKNTIKCVQASITIVFLDRYKDVSKENMQHKPVVIYERGQAV